MFYIIKEASQYAGARELGGAWCRCWLGWCCVTCPQPQPTLIKDDFNGWCLQKWSHKVISENNQIPSWACLAWHDPRSCPGEEDVVDVEVYWNVFRCVRHMRPRQQLVLPHFKLSLIIPPRLHRHGGGGPGDCMESYAEVQLSRSS